MQITTAYISVVLIWATTPLAIKWSSESIGFLFGISSRFILGAIVALFIAALIGKRIPLHKKAIQTYLVGGVGMSSAMLFVYWGSQYIPSGWISIIFGISPIMTALFAIHLLGEKGLNLFRLIAILLGISGLIAMVDTGSQYGTDKTHYGIFAVIIASILYSFSIVILKKISADIDTYSSVLGTLVIAAMLTVTIWACFDGYVPVEIPVRAGMSIIYLALIGSILGFMMFYFVLKHIEATRASLISLISPICALLLGHLSNNEPLNWEIVMGCLLILSGLILFEFEGAIRQPKRIKRTYS